MIFPSILKALRSEAHALGKSVGSYAVGIPDPNDEDGIELIDCSDERDDDLCHLTPVVLVHGFFHNWTGWIPLMKVLKEAGYVRFLRVNYESLFDDPREIAGAVAGRVDEMLDALDFDQAHVVGHSLGGAVLRYWETVLGGDEVLGAAVSLGGAQAGTPWARRIPGNLLPDAIRPLDPQGHFIASLTEEPATRWTTISGDADVLIPPPYGHLEGATQHTIEGAGHLGLLYNVQALELVRDSLVAAEPSTVSAATA